MMKLIPIIAGDPNSINVEIIAKAWKKRSDFKNKIFIIGNYNLIKRQLQSLNLNIALKKINSIEKYNFKKNLFVLDVPLKFKNIFNVSAMDKSKYIFKCFEIAIKLIKEKKIIGIINCPVNKKELFGKKIIGITEFLAKKERVLGNEVMLIYNEKLSVSPITTHIKLKKVSKSLSIKKIVKNIVTINNFFSKKFKIKPKIGILGLNPHNNEFLKGSEERKIIIPAVKKLKKMRINIYGPLSPDTAFLNFQKIGFKVLVGMYHDQVLSPFKALFKFNAINITLGLPYIRISPDHGVGKMMIRKNSANPDSLIESIKFFDN